MMACWRSIDRVQDTSTTLPVGGGGWMAVLVRCDDVGIRGGVECGMWMWGDADILKSKHGTRVRCGDLRVKIE